ncbi:TrmB family transcriptional regulator [Salinarchaeum sp. Harcht-Bsk1]|uniref:TrmB family transcriptional regulator sugar-binding domain-containing protein n=1 Tax=Salinarchaeum sp. Harcht-Bsk1 TaxID=1333523 RepID=UPI0003423B9C|nr:TrmB family transcriptional regulator sugar-binding domain-containing protein [Salinarchaeum sp. Harcht-Bsk1]AGN01406.1 TrmB family transcriptional regulator [Salinarchaeum sp. Harcht-Bsk1]
MFPGESTELSCVSDPGDALDRVRSLLDGAEHSAVVSIHEAYLDAIRPELEAARDRDALVVLLVYDCHTVVDPVTDFEPIASIARQTERIVPMYCVVDDLHGLYGDPELLVADDPALRASIVHNRDIAYALYGHLVGNYWRAGVETHSPEPPALPVSSDDVRGLVIDAAVHLRQATPIVATVEPVPSEDRDEIEGPVIDATQALLSPADSAVSLQSTLVLRTDTGRTTVGGPGAYLEDVKAVSGTLRAM